MFLYFVIAALAVYCVIYRIEINRDINDIRRRLDAHSNSLDYVMPRCDKNGGRIDAHENTIQDIEAALNGLEYAVYNHSIWIDRNKDEINNLKTNTKQ